MTHFFDLPFILKAQWLTNSDLVIGLIVTHNCIRGYSNWRPAEYFIITIIAGFIINSVTKRYISLI
jgi:hypothetical protein